MRALAAFQRARGLVPKEAAAGSGGGAGKEAVGVVKPGSATWSALLAAFGSVDGQYQAARVTEGVGLVYLPMPFDAAAANWKFWKPVTYPTAERRPPNPSK